MSTPKTSLRNLFSVLAITGCLLTGLPAISRAVELPGFTLFSGVGSGNELPFKLDFGGEPHQWDRYRLRIPAKKMKLAVAEFAVNYPKYFNGEFDGKSIEVHVAGKKVPLQSVKWDKEGHLFQIYPQEPIPAARSVELVFSDVKNPPSGGMYYFNCEILSPGDVPLRRYVGTWILNIGTEL